MVGESKLKALDYLASRVSNITDPFELAITAYALVLSGGNQQASVLAMDRLSKISRIGILTITHF